MDRSTIYGKWLSTTYKSQDGYDTPLCNERTIQKFNSINDFNLKCYADYQDFYLETLILYLNFLKMQLCTRYLKLQTNFEKRFVHYFY